MMDTTELPELTEDEVDHIVSLHKSVYHSDDRVISAFVRKTPSESSKVIISEWIQRDLKRSAFLKLQRTMLADASLKSSFLINTVDVSHWVKSSISKSGKLKAVLCVHPASTGGQQRMYLEIWNEDKLNMTFDLTASGVHGPVYTDELFAAFSWSPQEDKVAYIAEKNRPNTAPFSQRSTGDGSSGNKNKVLMGEQFVYEDDWGSCMSSRRQSVIAVCDLSKESIRVVDGLPDNIAPAQVQWDPSGEGIVGFGIYQLQRRLGIYFVPNRPNCIFHITLDGKYNVLSSEGMSVLLPRFSPDGKYLIWLQRPTDHRVVVSSSLVKCDWNTKKVTTVVDSVNKVIDTINGKPFYGIYTIGFPSRCWTSDSKYLLFSSSQKYQIRSYAVNIADGHLWDISSANEDDSISILDVSEDDFVVCSRTSFRESPILVSLYLPSVVGAANTVDPLWNSLSKPAHVSNASIILQFTVYDVETKKERCYATYYGPRSDRVKSVPLILFAHGGPHTSQPSAFLPTFHLFTLLGFGILIVHYQGSIGYGQDYVDALIGHIGSLDADDCYMALQSSLEKCPWLDEKRVVLFGGSYGGFLVLNMNSRFPNTFKATVAVNSPTNLPGMVFSSDIPDWPIGSLGFAFDGITGTISNTKLWQKLAEVSPIANIKNVKTPTLVVVSKKDRRTLPDQGLSYYHMLKELKVPTKAFIYDTTHFITETISSEMDFVINAIVWFKRCLKLSNELPSTL